MTEKKLSPQSPDGDFNRRSVLKMSGSTALAGLGLVGGAGNAAASSSEDEQAYLMEELSPKEKGQLRGEVFSSAAFKTVRRTTRERDFKPNFGNVEAAKLTVENTGQEKLVMKIPCDYVGDANDGLTRGAALFGHKSDDEILARCVSQCEGDPIYVDDCLTGIDDKSGAMDENEVNVYKIPTSSGGE